jgi:hypothetical protein
MIRALAGDLVVAMAGHGVLRLTGGSWPLRRFGVLGTVGLALLAGVALLAVVTAVVGVLGAPTAPLPIVAPALAAAAVAGVVPPRRAARPPRGSDPATWTGDGLSAMIAAGVGLRLALAAAKVPVISNDEYAIWALWGRTLSGMGYLDPRVFLGGYAHREYPLLVPSLIAWSDRWAGGALDGPAKVQIAVLVSAMLMATGWAVTRLAGPLAAVACVLLVAGMPRGISNLGLLLVADVPLLAFALPLVLVLAVWVRDQDLQALAAAALAAGAGSTKAEGLLFLLAAIGGAAVAAPTWRARRQLVTWSAGAAAALLPWLAYTWLYGLGSGVVNAETLSPSHLRVVLPLGADVALGMLKWMSPAGWQLWLVLPLALMLAVAGGRGRLALQLTATLTLSTLGMYAQYLISSSRHGTGRAAVTELQAHLASTAPRVLLLPAILASVTVPLLAGAVLWPTEGHGISPAASDL